MQQRPSVLHNTSMKGVVTSVEPGTPTVLRWARLAPGGTSLGGGHTDGFVEWEGCVWVDRWVES